MFDKTLERLGIRDDKGITVVNAVLAVAIGGAVGYFVVTSLLGGLDRTSFTTAQNTTFTNYSSNTDTAFVLIALLIIVLAAAAIMQALG